MTMTAEAFLRGARARSLCRALAAEPVRADALVHFSGGFARYGTFELPDEAVRAVVDALRLVDPTPIAEETDPLRFFPALDVAATSAMPWQEPHRLDAVTEDPRIRTALLPTAEAVLASAAAAWWSAGVDLGAQRIARRVPDGSSVAELASPATPEDLRAVRRALLESPGPPEDSPLDVPYSGAWWSVPTGGRLPVSTRSFEPRLGAVQLAMAEDASNDHAALVHLLRPEGPLRVFEVTSPQDWGDLVASYPLDVTRSRRHNWWRSTGRDGRWFIPDYEAVAADFDAIHVSVLGYLSGAGEAIPVPGGATVLAGWDPDATIWLTDRLTIDPDPVRWTRTDRDAVHEWRQA